MEDSPRGSADASGPSDVPAAPGAAEPNETLDMQRLLIATVVDYAIFVLDPAGYIQSWNPGAERLKGYTADEIIGKHFSIFYPEAENERGHPAWELREAEREGRYAEEGWRLRKDGESFWASVTITALRDESGTLVGFAKVTRDLTERKRSEEALRRSEERFRLLVQGVQDYGIFMLDPQGRVASWTEGAQRIKGYTEQEILGKHFSIFYSREDRTWDKPGMELEVASKLGRFEDEGWRLRKDGTRFWANVVITALFNDEGELFGFAKITRDLTERRKAEDRAIEDARRVAEAEAATRTKSEFLAAMSHELRTPLNAIGGYVDLIAEGIYGEIGDEQRQALDRVRSSQRHLLTLINDLLNISRIEAGRLEYDLAPVSLTDVAGTVAPMVGVQAERGGIRMEWQPPDEPVVAMADRSRLEQILLNLLTNAIRHTEAGGRISVRPETRREHVLVEVSDTGSGIPSEFLDAIFEPFTQAGRGANASSEGSGLGLAISRELARAMGGDLTVRSEVGVGSTFTLTLPGAG